MHLLSVWPLSGVIGSVWSKLNKLNVSEKLFPPYFNEILIDWKMSTINWLSISPNLKYRQILCMQLSILLYVSPAATNKLPIIIIMADAHSLSTS